MSKTLPTPLTALTAAKPLTALATAVAIAGIAAMAAVFLVPGSKVSAGPLAKPAEATLKVCTQRPWPYLNCVGTTVGNPHIRLVTTDQFGR